MADIKQIKTPDGTTYNLRDYRLFGISADGGLYFPPSITPYRVAKNSVLISEATNIDVADNRTLALFGGLPITLQSTASAGATRYEIPNTFANRFSAAAARNGYATINANTAGELTVNITAVYLANDPNRTPLVPYSGITENNNPIVIETAASANPEQAISEIRLYGSVTSNSSLFCGQDIGTGGVTNIGKILSLGQSQLALDGNNLMVGNGIFTSARRVALIGADIINTVEGACMTGQGHDSTLGTFDGLAAHGNYSDIQPDTAFAIGNGISNTVRSNLFEIKDDGSILVNSSSIALASHPVGSYYWTSDANFDPNNDWGGTWELMSEGLTLVSAGNTYPIQSGTTKDGGEATVTLSTSNLPAHTHGSKSLTGHLSITTVAQSSTGSSGIVSVESGGTGQYTGTNSQSRNYAKFNLDATHEHSSVGSGTAHNNMPPYKAAYCWHRTA